jgi:hypothetical protein
LFFRQVGVAQHLKAHVVKAFEGADAGGANGYGAAVVLEKFLYGLAAHGNVLCVHVMFANGFALHGLEGASANVQSQLLTVDAAGIEGSKHLRRKV